MSAEVAPILDPERQEEARRYARIRRHLLVLELGLGALYLLFWLVSGLSVQLRDAVDSLSLPWAIGLLLFTFLLFLPWALFAAPYSYYRGFILPHRFGLSTQTRLGWVEDTMKSALVALVLGIPLLLGLYALIRSIPNYWWIAVAIVYTLLGTVLTALAPILLLPIFYKLVPLSDDRINLVERLVALAKAARTRVQGVYQIDMSRRTIAANAALVGLGGTRRILVGDTLLENFTEDEICSVLAHELGHHVHRDIPLSIVVQTGLNFVLFFLAAMGLDLAVQQFGLLGPADPAGLPALLLITSLVGLIMLPVENGYSRWRERKADDFALQITQDPEAFASAMIRLANQNLADVDPDPKIVWLLYSHPPLRERIARAKAFEVG